LLVVYDEIIWFAVWRANAGFEGELFMNLRIVYILSVVLIFVIEVAIAIGVIGGIFVRESVGDMLVIMLIYAFLRAAFSRDPKYTAGVAIAIGFVAEGLQYIHLAALLGLQQDSVLYIIIGDTFTASDLLMYVIGGLLALAIDQYLLIPAFRKRRSSEQSDR
jgi:hypothetical protein